MKGLDEGVSLFPVWELFLQMRPVRIPLVQVIEDGPNPNPLCAALTISRLSVAEPHSQPSSYITLVRRFPASVGHSRRCRHCNKCIFKAVFQY